MELNLTPAETERPAERSFPYSNWGPAAGILGVVAAIGAGVALGIPGAFFTDADGDATTLGNIIFQAGTALGFLLVPMALVGWRGADSVGEILSRLGVRSFSVAEAAKGIGLAIAAYLAFAMVYSQLITPPEQEDIADGFGPIWVQVLLIVVAASVTEEVLFRGYLFAGLREKLPRYWAALIAGSIFGALHFISGPSAVPPLIFFGFVLCLLYERTGSIVPCIVLHMLNNSIALLAQ